MRKILTIFLITLTVCGCSHNNKKTTWESDRLKGKVKTIRTIAYDAVDTLNQVVKGQVIDDVYGSILIKYDSIGNWTEYRSFNPDGSNRWAEFPVFDRKNNMVERYDYTYSDSDSTLYLKYINQFDAKGNLVESARFNANDSIIARYIYKYDKRANVIETLIMKSSDSLSLRVISVYDENNNLIEVKQFNGGILNEISTSKYDNKRNQIEKNVYGIDENLKSRTTYSYNEKNDITDVYLYNSNGRLEKKSTFEYKYDFKDNWVEKTDYINEKVVKITERKLEYY